MPRERSQRAHRRHRRRAFLLSDHATLGARIRRNDTRRERAAPPSRSVAGARTRWRPSSCWSWCSRRVDQRSMSATDRAAPRRTPVARLQMSVAPADQLTGSRARSFQPGAYRDGGCRLMAGAWSSQALQVARRNSMCARLDRARSDADARNRRRRSARSFLRMAAWIGFWAGNTLKKVPAGGGPPATIAEVPPGLGWGASWARRRHDRFRIAIRASSKVSAAGGTPATVTTADG